MTRNANVPQRRTVPGNGMNNAAGTLSWPGCGPRRNDPGGGAGASWFEIYTMNH